MVLSDTSVGELPLTLILVCKTLKHCVCCRGGHFKSFVGYVGEGQVQNVKDEVMVAYFKITRLAMGGFGSLLVWNNTSSMEPRHKGASSMAGTAVVTVCL